MENISYECMKNFFKLGNSKKDKAMFQKLEKSMVQEKYVNGEVICRIGDKADAMYFIESGKVEVLGSGKQVLNEMEQGQYFGEYAIMTGDKRLSTVRSKGGTVVFRLSRKAVLEGINYRPAIYGDLIKDLYGQISQKHSKLLSVSSSRRGLIRDIKNQRRMSLPALFFHYTVVLLVFLAAYFLPVKYPSPAWVLLPVGFLIISISVTKRTMESLVLACLLSVVILYRYNFIFGFFDGIIDTVSGSGTIEIILILILLGAFSRLLSCSGGINALRRITMKRLKTQRTSLIMSLLCLIIIFLDDCLNLLIASICFMPVNDKKGVPREMSTFVLGITPEAVCALVPLSVWGVFITGIITVSIGESGSSLFYQSIPYNFISFLVLAMAFLAAAGKLPLVGALKAAQKRVEEGGPLWPPHSEKYFTKDEEVTRGNALNLFLPIVVLISASIVGGTISEGAFSINIGYGLIITLVFLFILYCFQRLMTPEEFFDNIITGAEGMLVPVILLVITFLFSKSVARLGLIEWLTGIMTAFMGNNNWLLAPLLFILFTIVCMLLGSSWSMYIFALPIAIQLSAATGGNTALCVGAVCAAGVAGDGLSYYQSNNLFIAAVIGCEPTALVNARMPYFVFITVLAAAMYLAAGIFL